MTLEILYNIVVNPYTCINPAQKIRKNTGKSVYLEALRGIHFSCKGYAFFLQEGTLFSWGYVYTLLQGHTLFFQVGIHFFPEGSWATKCGLSLGTNFELELSLVGTIWNNEYKSVPPSILIFQYI